MSAKRKALSFPDKRQLPDVYDKLPTTTSQREAAVSRGSLCSVLQQRDELLAVCGVGEGDKKRQRTGRAPVVDGVLGEWTTGARREQMISFLLWQ